MNAGRKGGKGRKEARKEKRWDKAKTIVPLFFFPLSARMIDDNMEGTVAWGGDHGKKMRETAMMATLSTTDENKTQPTHPGD